MNDTRLLLLDERDNVFVARARIRAGEVIEMEDRKIAVPSELPIGHKLARRAIPVGTTVIKYGAPMDRPSQILPWASTRTCTT